MDQRERKDSGLGGDLRGGGDGKSSVTFSQLIPLFTSKLFDPSRKSYLIPGVATILVAVISFVFLNQISGAPNREAYFTAVTRFGLVLSTYLAALAITYVYRLCGKNKPIWVIVGVALTTILLTRLYGAMIGVDCGRAAMVQGVDPVVAGCTPGPLPSPNPVADAWIVYGFKMMISAALPEEILKAVPLVLMLVLTTMGGRSAAGRAGLSEPLDGLLLGAASGAGFTILETGWLYVPGAGAIGLGLLLPRVIGAIGGHMAYSGIVGYGIGLSALKPERRAKIIGTSLAAAVGLHTAWNTMSYWQNSMHSSTTRSVAAGVQFLVGALSFAWMVASALKARQLSPTRSQNFATQAIATPAPAVRTPAAEPVRTPPVARAEPPRQAAKPNDGSRFELRIGNRALSLKEGGQLMERDIVGLESKQGNGVVGRVSPNPKDPTVLGLTNLSTTTWSATLARGEVREVASDKTIKLSAGTTIDFGVARGEVRERT
jgi:RsiW-degrading membrane proteinase PrsW (M82 family)